MLRFVLLVLVVVVSLCTAECVLSSHMTICHIPSSNKKQAAKHINSRHFELLMIWVSK